MLNWNRKAREFLSLLKKDTISIPACLSCHCTFLPPRALCPSCGTDALGWQEVPEALGTVYSLTQFADGRVVACVEIDAVTGPGRLTGLVIGDDAVSTQINDRVRVVLNEGVETEEDELRPPAFECAHSADAGPGGSDTGRHETKVAP